MAAFGAKHSVGRRLHTVLTSSSVSGAAATSSSAVCTPPPIHWSHWKLTSRNMSSATWQHTVTMDNLNPCIKSMEYAVRGPLVIRATEIEKEIQKVRNTWNDAFSQLSRLGLNALHLHYVNNLRPYAVVDERCDLPTYVIFVILSLTEVNNEMIACTLWYDSLERLLL